MPFHCCYGNCNSDSRVGRPGYDADVKFYRFPQPCLLLRDNVLTWSDSDERQHLKSCKKCTIAHTWLVRCKRADSRFQKVRHIRTSSYLCSRHFDDPPARIDYERHFPSSVPSNVSITSLSTLVWYIIIVYTWEVLISYEVVMVSSWFASSAKSILYYSTNVDFHVIVFAELIVLRKESAFEKEVGEKIQLHCR